MKGARHAFHREKDLESIGGEAEELKVIKTYISCNIIFTKTFLSRGN